MSFFLQHPQCCGLPLNYHLLRVSRIRTCALTIALPLSYRYPRGGIEPPNHSGVVTALNCNNSIQIVTTSALPGIWMPGPGLLATSICRTGWRTRTFMHGFGIRVVSHYINPANVDGAGLEPAATVLQTDALPLELSIHCWPGATRTLNSRFKRPLLCQLSYEPILRWR